MLKFLLKMFSNDNNLCSLIYRGSKSTLQQKEISAKLKKANNLCDIYIYINEKGFICK